MVLLDLALPDRNGIDLLADSATTIRSFRSSCLPPTEPSDAVRAMQAGTVNFVQRPWDNEKLLADVRAAIGRQRAEQENIQLKRALSGGYPFESIVGKSGPMLRILDRWRRSRPAARRCCCRARVERASN